MTPYQQELIRLANDEWLAYYQYWAGAAQVKNEKLKAELLEHADEERKHSDWLTDILADYGLTPEKQFSNIIANTNCGYDMPVQISDGSILQSNLAAERCAIEAYSKVLLQTDNPEHHKVLHKILTEEIKHEQDLLELQKETQGMYLVKAIIRKSQMSLFGHDHHVAYTRRSKSGAVSYIKQKGAQPVHDQGTLDFSAPPEPEALQKKTKRTEKQMESATLSDFLAEGKELLNKLEAKEGHTWINMLEHLESIHSETACIKKVQSMLKLSREQGSSGEIFMYEEDLVSAFRIVGADSMPTLKYFKKSSTDRPGATADSILLSPNGDHTDIAHEMGHHLEKSHPVIASAAKEFLRKRSHEKTGAKLAKLNTIEGFRDYRDDEIVVKGDFVTPYVGKVYKTKDATEVTSIGLQYVASDIQFYTLKDKDPEHFHFILGVLSYLSQRRGQKNSKGAKP